MPLQTRWFPALSCTRPVEGLQRLALSPESRRELWHLWHFKAVVGFIVMGNYEIQIQTGVLSFCMEVGNCSSFALKRARLGLAPGYLSFPPRMVVVPNIGHNLTTP